MAVFSFHVNDTFSVQVGCSRYLVKYRGLLREQQVLVEWPSFPSYRMSSVNSCNHGHQGTHTQAHRSNPFPQMMRCAVCKEKCHTDSN